MNLRFVEAFYWVATLQSVSRAAEKLFITQSAMSARIAALEQELGTLLLDRRDKQFRLTFAGLRFVTYAQRLLELQRESRRREMGSGAPQAMTLRLGAIESVLHSWLIPMVEKLRNDHEGLELELTVETTPVLLDQIRRGALDHDLRGAAGVDGRFAQQGAAAHGDGFCRQRAAAAAQALSAVRPHGPGHPHLPARLAAARGAAGPVPQAALEPKRVHTISSISAMTQLVEGGFGVATLPLAAAQRLVEHRNLKLLKCDTALQPLPVFATYRADRTSHAVETVVNEVFQYIDKQKNPQDRVASPQ